MTYNTKQREHIINAIKNIKKEFTIKELHEYLKDSTGLTTIYRLVDKLVDEGILRKTIDKNNVTYYQYLGNCNEKNHFYLKCESCGEVIHTECKQIEELTTHLMNEHKFKSTDSHIIINGICKKCGSNIWEVLTCLIV